jgi:starch synthase (maltosyl-transferring)
MPAKKKKPAPTKKKSAATKNVTKSVPAKKTAAGVTHASPKKPAPAKKPVAKQSPAKTSTSKFPAAKIPEARIPAHAVVENLLPQIEGGLFPVKSVLGEIVSVTADIFRDGHEKCEADLLFRRKGEDVWRSTPMRFIDNDAWAGEFEPDALGEWEFTIEARTRNREGYAVYAAFEEPYLHPHYGSLRVDPKAAEFAAWYEMFARSQGTDPHKSATFADMERRLPYVKDLGFDTIYLPPIHPIGRAKRKGRNNTLVAHPGEPGSPYAIGAYQDIGKGGGDGGHKAVHPELGTLTECRHFLDRCRSIGFEVVLDYALNCSPDHPYAKDHPDWFYREADGTIRCAENPPKRYEDIYPLNFFCDDRDALWRELKSVIDFWIDMGVTIFRVDNPHTKPFAFWDWMIAEVKKDHPEVMFLAEAFTRPKIMKRLAKGGFDLSYTYFTWRVTAAELREYCEELTQQEPSLYMRPIFFATTPDILPWHLQNASREMFLIRHALCSTLVGAYGMYNGYELCENDPYPGKEEYNDSEKYAFNVRDWNKPGNIKDFIRLVNHLRKEHPAMHQLKNLRFHECDNPNLLVYSKVDGEDRLLFVVNLDPVQAQAGWVTIDKPSLGLAGETIFGAYEVWSEQSYAWSDRNFVELNPHHAVMQVFQIEKF